jgi:DNA relaxase NicK
MVYNSEILPDAISDFQYSYVEKKVAEGHTPYVNHLYGYNGVQCAKLFTGDRESDKLVQLSGSECASIYHLFNDVTGHCTRLDIQVTVITGSYTPNVASDAAKSSAAARIGSKHPWKVRLQGGYGDGDTCYLGSMKSLSFMRIYDKDRESKQAEYSNAWRYEIVYQKEVANKVYQHLLQSTTPIQDIRATIHSYCRSRGVEPMFDSETGTIIRPSTSEATPDSMRLEYLHKAIRPMIYSLYTRGYWESVKRALDLDKLDEYTSLKLANDALAAELREVRQRKESD